MAVVAQSAVTVVSAWTEGGVSGKERVCKLVRVALSSQGGASNYMAASIFGLSKVEFVGNASADGDDISYVMTPSYAGDKVFVNTESSNTLVPADITDTIQFLVKGYV